MAETQKEFNFKIHGKTYKLVILDNDTLYVPDKNINPALKPKEATYSDIDNAFPSDYFFSELIKGELDTLDDLNVIENPNYMDTYFIKSEGRYYRCDEDGYFYPWVKTLDGLTEDDIIHALGYAPLSEADMNVIYDEIDNIFNSELPDVIKGSKASMSALNSLTDSVPGDIWFVVSEGKYYKFSIDGKWSEWSTVRSAITKEDLGLGNVENKSSETIRNEITSDDVVHALGFKPLTDEVNFDFESIRNELAGKVSKSGNKVLTDNNLSDELKGKYDDAVNKAHTHSNKNILDKTTESFTTEKNNKINTNETNISNANTQIADIYNRCGGGKNIFKTPTNVSAVYRGLTFSWDNDRVLTVTGIPTSTEDSYIPQYPYITDGSQFTAPYDCKMYALYSETHGDMWITAHKYRANGQQDYLSIGSSGVSLSAGDRLAGLYFRPTNTTTNYNFTVKFMIIPDGMGINAKPYVPYIPTNAELQSNFSILNDDNSKRCWYSRIISDTAFDSSFSFILRQNTMPNEKRIPVRIIFSTQYTMTPIEILFSVNSTNASPFKIAMLHGGIESGSTLKVAIYSKTVADEKSTYYTVKILNKTLLYGMVYVEYPCDNNKHMFTVSSSSTQITETTEDAKKILIYTPTYSLMS